MSIPWCTMRIRSRSAGVSRSASFKASAIRCLAEVVRCIGVFTIRATSCSWTVNTCVATAESPKVASVALSTRSDLYTSIASPKSGNSISSIGPGAHSCTGSTSITFGASCACRRRPCQIIETIGCTNIQPRWISGIADIITHHSFSRISWR